MVCALFQWLLCSAKAEAPDLPRLWFRDLFPVQKTGELTVFFWESRLTWLYLQWEKQHEGLTCDQYTEWKDGNDPDKQNEGVTKHLQIHGIDCPKCKFRYALARGGCMHFTCTQCKYEFCYGCNKPFMMGAKCIVSQYCAKLGLHSHHPRNCLFYLRDKEPHQLQKLLKVRRGWGIDNKQFIINWSSLADEQRDLWLWPGRGFAKRRRWSESVTEMSSAVAKGDPYGTGGCGVQRGRSGWIRGTLSVSGMRKENNNHLEMISEIHLSNLPFNPIHSRSLVTEHWNIGSAVPVFISSHHYVEYLCYSIRENRLDTLDILTTDDLEIVVRRQNFRMPPRPFGIVDGIYRQELVQVRMGD